jgi:hypothetical protein
MACVELAVVDVLCSPLPRGRHAKDLPADVYAAVYGVWSAMTDLMRVMQAHADDQLD